MSIIKSADSNDNLEQDRREVIAEVIAGLIAEVIERERRRDAATGRPWRWLEFFSSFFSEWNYIFWDDSKKV